MSGAALDHGHPDRLPGGPGYWVQLRYRDGPDARQPGAHQAIGFFAAVEAQAVDAGARILPIREEQLKERLGERFRELDVPLLVEWPDGRRAALLFVFEEETEPARFSIQRLAHYCLDLAELYA